MPFLVVVTGVFLLAGCESSRLHSQGLKELEQGHFEVGVQKLRQAAAGSPDNLVFKSDLLSKQEEAVQKLVAEGDRARSAGEFAAAERAYGRVLAIEAANSRAKRGIEAVAADQRHAQQVREAQQAIKAGDLERADAGLRAVLAEDPGYAAAASLRTQIDTLRGPVTVSPKLKTRDNRPVTLQFRDAPTKMVFEVLSRQTSINFIFDKDVKSDGRTTIFVQDVPIEQAIDLVLGQNQLARQILSDNMVLIYPNTPAKQKDYQDQIVRTFYLDAASPKDVESMLKTVLDIKTLMINERANAVIVRDTPEVVRMAEKLVATVDIAEPEVMLEVEVVEITHSRMQQLGINYPSSATISTPDNLVINDLNGGSGSVINGNSITVSKLSVTADALKTTGTSNVLASPRIRARNKEKAKVLIGSRVPTITTAVTPTGVGGATIANTQVQYLDVGLTLDVEPTIFSNDDVAIKVGLEVSSIVNTVKIGQTIAYEIGTRNVTTLLQLKDGETQILAGLIKDSDTKSASKIPGLGDIPLVGRLFADTTTKRDKSEIVLSITPRIIRARARPSADNSEFWYGTESRNGMAPLGSNAWPGSRKADLAVAAGTAAVATANVSTQVPATVVGAAAATQEAAPAAQRPPQRSAALRGVTLVPQGRPLEGQAIAPAQLASSIQGPDQLKVGDEFDVTLHMEFPQRVGRVRAQLSFDSAAFQLLSGTPGDLVPESMGAKVAGRTGGAQLDVLAPADSPLAGSGEIMVLHFKALQARSKTAFAGLVSVVGADGAAMTSSTPDALPVVVAQ
jgi:general secretion pathway protein D